MATNKRLIKSNDEAAGGASFNTVLYTGNGTTNPITGVGFQPDFTWIKTRSTDNGHILHDSVRGVTKFLSLPSTGAEGTLNNFFNSFDADGFTLGTNSNHVSWNATGDNYVAWNWKAGGAAVTNTDGTITSQVSANTEAGFSIVSYTGNGSVGNFGHGLGDSPSIVIIRGRSIAEDWFVLYDTTNTPPNYMKLNTTEAGSASSGVFPSPATSTVVNVGGGSANNSSGNTYIAYCFAEVAGFSKFGSYTGNGLPLGPTITTGFEPAFVMTKSTDTNSGWIIWDNKRNPTNERTKALFPHSSLNEVDGRYKIDINTNGFQITTTDSNQNVLNENYIYMAFANQF